MKDINYYLNLPYEIIIRRLDASEGGGYLARYKDFPFICGDGENEAEAIDDVKKAFEFVITQDLKEHKIIKEPSDDSQRVRINITLPKAVLEAIDKATHNRSKFLADSAKQALNLI